MHLFSISAVCAGMILLLGLSSCSDQLDGYKDKSFTIEQAKSYFENNTQGLSLVEYLQPSTKSLVPSRYENITPDWENARVRIKNGVATIVAELTNSGELQASLQYSAGKRKIATEEGVSFSSSLVIQKHLHTGQLSRYVVTTVGRNNTGPAVFLGENSAFSGIMMFSTETGRCFKAYEVKNSHYHKLYKHTHSPSDSLHGNHIQIVLGFSVSSHIHTRGGGGTGYSSGENNDCYCYACHALTNFDDGYCAHCGAPPEELGNGEFYYFCPKCGRIEDMCICPSEDDNPEEPENPTVYCPHCGDAGCSGECLNASGGTGGGSGNNPNGSQIGTFHVHRQGEYLLPNVRDNIETQLDNSCAIESLVYISEVLGSPINLADVLLYAWYISGKCPVLDGFMSSVNDASDLFGHYFYIEKNCSIVNALDSRFPLYGIIYMGKDINDKDYYHCVSIVGYNTDDNTLIVMDTLTGRLTDIEEGNISEYAAVTGIK